MSGFKHSKETKDKIRETCKRRYKEGKIKNCFKKGHKGFCAMLGKHHSEKSKKQMGETKKRLIKEGKIQPLFKKGHIITKEVGQKIRESNMRRKISEETRIKLRGRTTWNKNKIGCFSKDTINLMKIAKLGKTHSIEHKEKQRISAIKRIERQKLNGLPLTPCIGNYETQILDNLEYCFGYTISRQYKTNGYFLDGYCPMLNLAIEVDEGFHNSKIEKDMLRQKEIEKELNCKFLRINI